MKTVFYSVQYIAKAGGAQVAQMSGSQCTTRSGCDLHDQVYEIACDWYKSKGSLPLSDVSVHIVALNYI